MLSATARQTLGVMAAGMVVGACPPAASAVTPATAEEELVAADLSPVPLFPPQLPARLRDANTSLKIRGQRFTVTWDRGDGSRGLPIGYVQFSRGPANALEANKRLARSRGFKPRTTRIDDRKVVFLCGHICGYSWRAQGFTYSVFGIYFQRPGAERPDQRAVIKALRVLR